MCSLAFLKKNAEISKMKLYSYSPVFPIDYNGSMIKIKIIIFSPVNDLRAITFASPFYLAQVFVLSSALSIIFFVHFQQK